jgi:hypothetical protein
MGMIRFIHLLSIWGILLAIYPMMTVSFGSLEVICSDIVVLWPFLPFCVIIMDDYGHDASTYFEYV